MATLFGEHLEVTLRSRISSHNFDDGPGCQAIERLLGFQQGHGASETGQVEFEGNGLIHRGILASALAKTEFSLSIFCMIHPLFGGTPHPQISQPGTISAVFHKPYAT
jgi:hypothetical protein